MARTPIGVKRCVQVVRGITSESPQERLAWAAAFVNWADEGEVDAQEAAPIAAVLAWVTLLEPDKNKVRSEFLDALDALAQKDLAPTAVLEKVTKGLSWQDLDSTEVEFYETLVNKLHEQRGQTDP